MSKTLQLNSTHLAIADLVTQRVVAALAASGFGPNRDSNGNQSAARLAAELKDTVGESAANADSDDETELADDNPTLAVNGRSVRDSSFMLEDESDPKSKKTFLKAGTRKAFLVSAKRTTLEGLRATMVSEGPDRKAIRTEIEISGVIAPKQYNGPNGGNVGMFGQGLSMRIVNPDGSEYTLTCASLCFIAKERHA